MGIHPGTESSSVSVDLLSTEDQEGPEAEIRPKAMNIE